MRRWRVRKTQCQTCIDEQMGGHGWDGRRVWVIYRDDGEFSCRPSHAEAIAYATRKAIAYGDYPKETQS